MPIRRARVTLRDLDRLHGNVLQWMGGWMAVDKQVPVLCAVADVPIENGIARTQTLYVRTDRPGPSAPAPSICARARWT